MIYKSQSNKEFLKNWNNIFADLPNKKLNEIRGFLINKKFNQAEEINSYGDIFPGLIRIKNGKVRCIFENKNNLHLLNSYKEGEVF